MTTTVTLTGTGVPYPDAGRAGAGVLVRHGETVLQFDAGRATAMRLAEAGVLPTGLTAVFLTHVHSDHVEALPDLAMTRWIQQELVPCGPLAVVCTEGPATEFARGMLAPYAFDIGLRRDHAGHASSPEVIVSAFTPSATPEVVWTSAGGLVTVAAVGVHHEPVMDAVAYRITTPDAAIVISGDTRVCDEVERLSAGVDLLVHEVCRASALAAFVVGTAFEKIFSYHADSVALGGLAKRAAVQHLVLTHLIPPPVTSEDEALYLGDLSQGGYDGTVSVGRDSMTFTF